MMQFSVLEILTAFGVISGFLFAVFTVYRSLEKSPLLKTGIFIFASVTATFFILYLIPLLNAENNFINILTQSVLYYVFVLFISLAYLFNISYVSWYYMRKYTYENPTIEATKAYEEHLRLALNKLPQTGNKRTIRRAARTIFNNIKDIVFEDVNSVSFDIALLRPLMNGYFEVIEQNDRMNNKLDDDAPIYNFRWKKDTHGDIQSVAGYAVANDETVLISDLSDERERIQYKWVNVENGDDSIPTGSLLVIPMSDLQILSREQNKKNIAVLCITCSKKDYLNLQHRQRIARLFADKLAIVALLDDFAQKRFQPHTDPPASDSHQPE